MRASLPWFSRNAIALSAVALSVGVLAACSSSGSSSSSSAEHKREREREQLGEHDADHDRCVAVPHRRLLRRRARPIEKGYKLWAQGRQRGRRHHGPAGQADDPERQQLAQPGRHQLPDADQHRPRRPDLRAVLLAADRPRVGGGGPQRLRVHRGRRRRADGVRHAANEADHNVFDVSPAGRGRAHAVRELHREPAGQRSGRRPRRTRWPTTRSPTRRCSSPSRSCRRSA